MGGVYEYGFSILGGEVTEEHLNKLNESNECVELFNKNDKGEIRVNKDFLVVAITVGI
jgi:hypothetical protein